MQLLHPKQQRLKHTRTENKCLQHCGTKRQFTSYALSGSVHSQVCLRLRDRLLDAGRAPDKNIHGLDERKKTKTLEEAVNVTECGYENKP